MDRSQGACPQERKKGRKKNGKYNKGLLCLHGFGGDKDSTVIRNLIPCFSGCGFNIVAFDWPAHGESEMADEELTVENCLADLNYLVESMHRDYEELPV